MPRTSTITPEEQATFADAYKKYGSFDKAARALRVPRWKIVKSFYRLEGRCDCGKPLDTDGLTCSICLARANRTKKSIATSRKEAGLCVTCGNPLSPKSKNYCEIHREQERSRQLLRRQFRVENNLCVSCGNPLDGQSTHHCSKCFGVTIPGTNGNGKSNKDDNGEDHLCKRILERDNYKCVVCGSSLPRLEIHHLSYTSNSEENLVTLCLTCHHAISMLSHCTNVPKLMEFFYQHTV